MPDIGEDQQSRVKIVSVPDGLELEDERKDVSKLVQSINRVMPGTVRKNVKVELLPNLSTLSPTEFAWNNPGHPFLQEIMFEYLESIHRTLESSDWVLCS
ncbi:hypothetical protein LWI29_011005 [Acer saccharum]|uniref:Uncharacterized protein n=1 Tax=Acer saccharum TaxID=4024 RepID=A0AA39VPF3_ACESA|nr:hypothetical protein LWI29_011005 [Acer saccharum]